MTEFTKEQLAEIAKRKWWRWPEDKSKNAMVPWFVVTWRLVFWPVLMVGMALAWFAAFFMYGVDDARRLWRSL